MPTLRGKQLKNKGSFVAIDGPNGVGKSAVVGRVCEMLKTKSVPFLQTREPTTSFNRDHEEKHGSELAKLIVEDRRKHIIDEIEPAIKKGKIVVTDRYIASSLVYRSLDGIPFEIAWRENKKFLSPDLYILLIASPNILEDRIGRREEKSRFEREYTPAEELDQYKKAHDFLKKQGETTFVIENEGALEDVAARIVKILPRLNEN